MEQVDHHSHHKAAEPGADPALEEAYRADEIPDKGNGREED
jgi:hypothetical protein